MNDRGHVPPESNSNTADSEDALHERIRQLEAALRNIYTAEHNEYCDMVDGDGDHCTCCESCRNRIDIAGRALGEK
jgi:hypothetical protein